MNKLIDAPFLAVLLLFFSITPLNAQTRLYDVYISGNVGIALTENAELTDSTIPDLEVEVGFDDNLTLSGAVGLVGGYYRSELEVSYQEHDLDSISVSGITVDPADFGVSGDLSILTGLVNAYFDFESGFPNLRPYVTGGLGFTNAEVNGAIEVVSVDGTSITDNDDDSAFAYQLGAGLGYSITDNITLDLRYRFFSAPNLEFETTETKFKSHNLSAGVRVRF
jgi:opacity protein-like surface antigen